MAYKNFNCQILETQIKKPCNLKSCRYNIQNPYAMNCFLQHQSTNEDITLAEIAYFYKKPLKKLRKIHRSAVSKIYDKVISEKASTYFKIHYHKTTKVCLACESLVEDPIYLAEGHVVCSECNQYPSRLWQYAIKNNIEIKDTIVIFKDLFKNLFVLDTFLESPRGTFKRIWEKQNDQS